MASTRRRDVRYRNGEWQYLEYSPSTGRILKILMTTTDRKVDMDNMVIGWERREKETEEDRRFKAIEDCNIEEATNRHHGEDISEQ